jgi:hypothetical protein
MSSSQTLVLHDSLQTLAEPITSDRGSCAEGIRPSNGGAQRPTASLDARPPSTSAPKRIAINGECSPTASPASINDELHTGHPMAGNVRLWEPRGEMWKAGGSQDKAARYKATRSPGERRIGQAKVVQGGSLKGVAAPRRVRGSPWTGFVRSLTTGVGQQSAAGRNGLVMVSVEVDGGRNWEAGTSSQTEVGWRRRGRSSGGEDNGGQSSRESER